MNAKRLTLADQVLLHLATHQIREYDFGYVAPPELTQDGIANALGIGRNNIPRILKKLMKDGLIEEKKAHVHGAKHRRKVYILTPKGFLKVIELREEYGK